MRVALSALFLVTLVLASASSSHASAVTRSPAKSARLRPAPTVELEHLTTHERLPLRPDLPGGGFSTKQVKRVAELLRCHHTGKRHAISGRLVELLYTTAKHFRSDKLLVVAGYRAPQIAKAKGNPRSPHKRGVACDFQLPGVENQQIGDYLRGTFPRIGVGYYPNSGFVHLDVGRKKEASWVDYSHPGERASYGRAPRLRSGHRTVALRG
jgi:uncharacterized protein YcbK (DUF882 family)